jgi:hypothetical protein
MQAYDYFLQAADQETFIKTQAPLWQISEQDVYDVLVRECAARRAAEYPPQTDYLDAMVKNDTEQVQAYINACLAVKQKYPKPPLP